jgi:hypothetical protein
MFDGIKLLCLGNRNDGRFWQICASPAIVTREKYLKIANEGYKCIACGHKSDFIKPFFLRLINLQKLVAQFEDTGFTVINYGLGFEFCHEDGFDTTPYVLEHNDWFHWNMQISNITIASLKEPVNKLDITEDAFFKADPYPCPGKTALTFNKALRIKSLCTLDHEITNLLLLKNLLRAIRIYNSAWVSLLGSFVNAVPVDLLHGLYTHLSNVNSLTELFPEDLYE